MKCQECKSEVNSTFYELSTGIYQICSFCGQEYELVVIPKAFKLKKVNIGVLENNKFLELKNHEISPL